MKKIYRGLLSVIIGITGMYLASCESDDYINDGGKANEYVDMTTYDFLASHPKFDSLVAVIDKAGLKDLVNSNITFFASTNYSIENYVKAKKRIKVIELGDENIDFGIKDISKAELDSLKLYMFDGAVGREQMTTNGTMLVPKLGASANVRYMLKLRRTFDYSSYLDYVDYVNFTKVIGTLDEDELDQDAIPDDQQDISYDCQTSGIKTKTGIIHVLSDNHRLMFNAQSIEGL